MRYPLLVVGVALSVAACSDAGVGPTDPIRTAPTVQMSHIGEGAEDTSGELCGGLSPCDAFDYRGDGSIGAPGLCFLPPAVNNHTSDPACSGDLLPGLDGVFQLAWCRVLYVTDGETAPYIAHIDDDPDSPLDCQDPTDWQDLVSDGSGHYSAPVRWRRNEADDGDVFRLYVVRGDVMFAHRDVVIDPNLTTPADGYVHAIGYGNEPIKVLITDAFSCVKFDTQEEGTENAATCLIAGATSVSFDTDQVTTTFNFPDGNPTFLADFEVSECLSLGFSSDGNGGATGNALVDTPLADCKISLSSEELESLTVPGQIEVTVNDSRWDDEVANAPFREARLNVLQVDEFGVGSLPPTADPGWFGLATSEVAALRWIGWGLDKLAGLFGPEPLYAALRGGWDFTRMSDFQVALMPVMDHDATGVACASGAPHCLDLGTFSGPDPVPVSVKVTAPSSSGPLTYPTDHFDVPDTRLHFFPTTGAVVCPVGSDPDALGRGCYEAGDDDLSTVPPSAWNHLVVVTGTDGTGSVDWTLAPGANTLNVVACGVARPGDNEANPPAEPGADGVWGTLTPGACSSRDRTGAFDNGPADGFTPFEPVDVENEVAIHGLPLTFEARTCPQIGVDGIKDDAWEECADKTAFSAPLTGPKGGDNAWLYTYSDGDALYVALEVATNDLGNKIFINLAEESAGGDFVGRAGDDLLVIDFGDPAVDNDWHFTLACEGNNAASLCGDSDAPEGDGVDENNVDQNLVAAAQVDGAGPGRVFYEFVRPFASLNAGTEDLDLAALSDGTVGLRLRVTQGQGGGKGGFVYPDPQTSSTLYHPVTIE